MYNCFEELKEKTLPVIKAYHDDLLKHDKRLLEQFPESRFLHFAGEHGTHIVFITKHTEYPPKGKLVRYIFDFADRYKILMDKRPLVGSILKNPMWTSKIHFFDGHRLRRVDAVKAREIMQDYERHILAIWNEENRHEAVAA